jgi:hypothetical protein
MKAVIVIAAAALVAFTGWWLASPENRSDKSDETHRAYKSPPTTTLTDSTTVFEKAFWKHPTANDKILHAERREWSDAAGLQKWQWFIEVEPSPELIKHLRDDNAFNLIASTSSKPIEGAPIWFTVSSDASTLSSPQSNMRISFDSKSHRLHATDSGTGFRPGAPEPSKPLTQSQPTGRLPTTPPPQVQN